MRIVRRSLFVGAAALAAAPILSAALYERFSSRGDADFANKVLSAMRHGFGGHVEKGTDKLEERRC